MAEQTQCIRCSRLIDAHARICPFCNWDQANTAVPPVEPTIASDYVPPEERDWRRYLLMGVGAFVLLVASFALGSLIHGHNPPKNAKSPIDATDAAHKAAAAKPGPASSVTLFPVNDTAGIEQPITSAPAPNIAQGVPTEYQRSDATAVSSAEYGQLAARANAEKKAAVPAVDPRSLAGPAYAQGQPPQSAAEAPQAQSKQEGSISIRTRPQPISQPTPDITVDQTSSVRLDLLVGADGRVKEIDLHGGIPGQSAKIIGAVQRWTFKPATVNGVPVEAPFSVEITFKGHE